MLHNSNKVHIRVDLYVFKELLRQKQFGKEKNVLNTFVSWLGTWRFCWLVFFLGFLREVLWLLHFYECTSTLLLMLSPPEVSRRGCSIHWTFHIPKIRFSVLTGAVASPPVLAVQIYLIMKIVIDLGLEKQKGAPVTQRFLILSVTVSLQTLHIHTQAFRYFIIQVKDKVLLHVSNVSRRKNISANGIDTVERKSFSKCLLCKINMIYSPRGPEHWQVLCDLKSPCIVPLKFTALLWKNYILPLL